MSNPKDRLDPYADMDKIISGDWKARAPQNQDEEQFAASEFNPYAAQEAEQAEQAAIGTLLVSPHTGEAATGDDGRAMALS